MNKLILLNSKHPNMITIQKNNHHFLKRFGVWLNGKCSWLNSDEWEMSSKQERGSDLSIVVAFHKEWRIQLTILQEFKKEESSFVYTFVFKNQSEELRNIKFVVHQQRCGNVSSKVAFVSPLKQTIMHYGSPILTLLAANFFRSKVSQLAVGKREIIWSEISGNLAVSPLCQTGHESMMVTSIQLDPWQETYGRIWEINGTSEEEVMQRHDRQIRSEHLKQVTKQIL
ncbi:hypothetical protein [Halalkalibacter okhensis]|uniref:Uncharacterized protein n=1 Tax=Halalkalibacter okhensis TaxID=333138 RepID=A0A0B0IKN0_9BACI|nr:hypothetical protein [Halalkalibacter okhensis]KHF41835.1 hypothetical protein LQ50_00620 [Halalkalibacter okhensis]